MTAVVGTDILVDIALEQEPCWAAVAKVIEWAENSPGQVAVAWHSLANLAYLVRPDARPFLEHLLRFVDVAATGTREAKQALGFPMNDLEDALQAAAAIAFGADCIVTRNLGHYRKSPVPALSPAQFLQQLER
jgi:sugar/nucleoside kinase (ribokinase family)